MMITSDDNRMRILRIIIGMIIRTIMKIITVTIRTTASGDNSGSSR